MDRAVVDRLTTMRGPAESYSEVILRLVETTAFDDERVV
jgi:predicted CopG family antitoxin